tara:strand:- start:735 stop:1394 length:660 start_codon:yes stop_codon:yes gene_type:complete
MDLDLFYRNHKKNCERIIQKHINLIPNNGIIFDIGSNLGMFSEVLLDIYPNIQIHAFEPVKEYYEYSIKKLELPKNNVKINNFGLSNKSEEKYIFIDSKENTNNPGWNTYIQEKTQQKMNKIKTKLKTLNEYCLDNNITQIDFIKIDTEGFEAYVLDGFLDTLKILEKKPYMLIEIGWGSKHPHFNFSKKIFDELYKLGYVSENINFLKGTSDILFTPP